MDDSCAVCADSLEWVAYGACGHKDVCSTCVARLRFICDDLNCCICKTKSDAVFVTKAMGDFTETINDFSVFPSNPKEGKTGKYWYHEDTQAFFDDTDHYKMIKAMCRLSCSECDRLEEQNGEASRKKPPRFKNVEHLKGHLFHWHKLLMCSLCLEGRKIFICEQKLYTRTQLTQHIKAGNSVVDGTENERGGFMGHPMCEFCKSPSYGDNELFIHMSTEHFTCHICKRQHPEQHDYFKNYDDLEIHFRQDHSLCEDETCLGKKFVVFASESDLKRHNATEHGGRMSRSQRNAALQIPTSFRYRSSEQNNRRRFQRERTDSDFDAAIQESLESSMPSRCQTAADDEEMSRGEPSAAASDSELSARYRQAVSLSGTLGESSFPPLPVASGSGQQNSHMNGPSKKAMSGTLGKSSFPPLPVASGSGQQNSHMNGPPKKTMALHLHKQAPKVIVSSSRPLRPAAAATSTSAWPSLGGASGSASGSVQSKPRPEIATPSSQSRLPSFAGSLVSSGSTSRMSHSSSAPNLSHQRKPIAAPSTSDFPPVSAAQVRKPLPPTTDEKEVKVKDVRTANQTMLDRMRSALGFDEEKLQTFKDISSYYRQNLIDTETYLTHVAQYGLSDFIPELADLLPNADKRKELIEAYNLNFAYDSHRQNGWGGGVRIVEGGNNSKKGKGKTVYNGKDKGKAIENNSTKNKMADDVISKVKELQSSYRASEEDVEVLSKDGYRADKGKSKLVIREPSLVGSSEPLRLENTSETSGSNGNGKSKQRKKTSKFLRARLGDGSIDSFLDRNNEPDPDPEPDADTLNGDSLPVRGVWRNGGGQRLLAKPSRST